VNTAEWKIYHGGLWTEILRDLCGGVFCDGTGDFCAMFMVVTIKKEVSDGGVKRLREG
jgi:hypothetical protein